MLDHILLSPLLEPRQCCIGDFDGGVWHARKMGNLDAVAVSVHSRFQAMRVREVAIL